MVASTSVQGRLDNSEAGEQTGVMPTEPTELTAFSPTLNFEGKFSPGSKLLLSLCFEALATLLET